MLGLDQTGGWASDIAELIEHKSINKSRQNMESMPSAGLLKPPTPLAQGGGDIRSDLGVRVESPGQPDAHLMQANNKTVSGIIEPSSPDVLFREAR